MVERKGNPELEKRLHEARNIPKDLLERIDMQVLRALDYHLTYARPIDSRSGEAQAVKKRSRRVA